MVASKTMKEYSIAWKIETSESVGNDTAYEGPDCHSNERHK